jgi:hypothetical protein
MQPKHSTPSVRSERWHRWKRTSLRVRTPPPWGALGGRGTTAIDELVDALKFSPALTGQDACLNGTTVDEAVEAGTASAAAARRGRGRPVVDASVRFGLLFLEVCEELPFARQALENVRAAGPEYARVARQCARRSPFRRCRQDHHTQVHLGAITTIANVPGYVETRPFNTHHYQLTDR